MTEIKLEPASVGEIGLSLYFLEQEGLLYPSTNRIISSLSVKVNGEFAGLMQLYEGHAPPGVVGISIYILEIYRKQGLGEFAIEEVLKNPGSIKRLETCGELSNKAAVKLFEKLGFTQEGVLKNWYPRNGKYEDAVIYAKVL